MRLVIALMLAVAIAPSARAHEPTFIDLHYSEGVVRGDALRRLSGFQFLRVPVGTHLVLRWRSDEDMDVILQGYKIETKVPAGGEGLMRIDANITGRFAVEKRDGLHQTLMYLDIRPASPLE